MRHRQPLYNVTPAAPNLMTALELSALSVETLVREAFLREQKPMTWFEVMEVIHDFGVHRIHEGSVKRACTNLTEDRTGKSGVVLEKALLVIDREDQLPSPHNPRIRCCRYKLRMTA